MLLCVSASLISRHTVHSGEGEATPPVSIGVQIVLLLVASVLVSVLCSFDMITCLAMLRRVLARDTRVSILCYVQNSRMLISSIVFQCSS